MVNVVGGKNFVRYLLVARIEEFFDESARNGLAHFGHAVYEDSSSRRLFPHRALAVRADSDLSSGVIFAARALPPFKPPRRPSFRASLRSSSSTRSSSVMQRF